MNIYQSSMSKTAFNLSWVIIEQVFPTYVDDEKFLNEMAAVFEDTQRTDNVKTVKIGNIEYKIYFPSNSVQMYFKEVN